MSASFLNGPDRLAIEDGTALHLLPALAVFEARREAKELAAALSGEEALCANACLLAKAWRRNGRRVCSDGRAVLERLGVSQIQALARRFAEFDREANPGLLSAEGEIDALKKASGACRRSGSAGMCSARSAPFPRSRVSAR